MIQITKRFWRYDTNYKTIKGPYMHNWIYFDSKISLSKNTPRPQHNADIVATIVTSHHLFNTFFLGFIEISLT